MQATYALGTFSTSGREGRWPGIITEGRVLPLDALFPDAPDQLGALFSDWSAWDERLSKAMAEAPDTGWIAEQDTTAHLPHMPDNLFGAGANYRAHVIQLVVDSGAGDAHHLPREERQKLAERAMDERAASGKPFIWCGLRSSVAGPEERFVIPYDVVQPDWELELAVVIGKPARRVTAATALDHVAGYLIANDITSRELVSRPDLKALGMDWMACKASPGFKVLGPYITPARFVPDPQKLHIRLSLNGQVMQDESTSDMLFGVAKLIEWTSAHAHLQPGDVIMTGSPSGNGTHYDRFLRDGDEMRGRIDGIMGEQVTHCVLEVKPE